MNVLVIDFESSGVDPERDRITEIGACFVDKDWDPIVGFNQLIYDPDAAPLSNEIMELTGITNDMLRAEGVLVKDAFFELAKLVTEETKYVVAYNSEFDEGMFKATVIRENLDLIPEINYLMQIPWLCAMRDVEKNYKHKCWKLSHLCLDHGLTVDPNVLHRASADVFLTREMLSHIGETALNMAAFREEPWAYLCAVIPAPWEDNGVGKSAAQKLGYTWEQAKGSTQKFEKRWVKRVKERFVDEEVKKASFKVRRINTAS